MPIVLWYRVGSYKTSKAEGATGGFTIDELLRIEAGETATKQAHALNKAEEKVVKPILTGIAEGIEDQDRVA